jgi:hypothetical protein
MPSIFEKKIADQFVERINKLRETSTPNWGSMGAAEMLAHCNVTYEMAYTDKYPKPNFLLKLILKAFVKKW